LFVKDEKVSFKRPLFGEFKHIQRIRINVKYLLLSITDLSAQELKFIGFVFTRTKTA